MRWESGRRSDNVEFDSGSSGNSGGMKGGLGIVGLIIVAVIAYVSGDSSLFFNALTGYSSNATHQSQSVGFQPKTKQEQRLTEFVKVVLGNTEDVWAQQFKKYGGTYVPPKLVLFSKGVRSGCGAATTQSGPFYCSADKKVYLDLAFLAELKKLGAPGDFAFAYAIAHEVGHHVSDLLGILPKVNQEEQRLNKIDANKLSIMLELQADCFAGVWAYHADKDYHMLETTDAEEGLKAAASVGDDALIGNRPDLFTHGTSQQRMQWLSTGMKSGEMDSCNTFGFYKVAL